MTQPKIRTLLKLQIRVNNGCDLHYIAVKGPQAFFVLTIASQLVVFNVNLVLMSIKFNSEHNKPFRCTKSVSTGTKCPHKEHQIKTQKILSFNIATPV
jgi:hypothetical protein